MKRFDTLLVANRGEIACRVIRSASAMGIRTVSVFVESDTDALHVARADEAVRIGSYLDSEQILAAARLTGASAVHPGYGFLAENASFARAVLEDGLVWVGPSPEVIASMGDKITAKKLAFEAGVPVLKSSDEPSEFGSLGFPILIKAAGEVAAKACGWSSPLPNLTKQWQRLVAKRCLGLVMIVCLQSAMCAAHVTSRFKS